MMIESTELAMQVRDGLSVLSFWTTVVGIVLVGVWIGWDQRKREKALTKEVEQMYYEAAKLGLTPENLNDMTPTQWKEFRGHAKYWREVQKLAPYGQPIK